MYFTVNCFSNFTGNTTFALNGQNPVNLRHERKSVVLEDWHDFTVKTRLSKRKARLSKSKGSFFTGFHEIFTAVILLQKFFTVYLIR